MITVEYGLMQWQEWHIMRIEIAMQSSMPCLPATVAMLDTDANTLTFAVPYYEN